MNAERIRELFMEGVSQQIDVREYRGGYLVTTPITLADGAPFQVRADFDGEDVTLNDLGQVAGELDAAGFDITSQSGEKHWSHVLQSVGFAPAIGADPWELALTAPRELFGAAVLSLADVAASADGLRVLSASYRPKTLQERLVRSVHAAAPEARINQRARMRMRGGGERQVSFSASTVHTAYVQAITASQGPYAGYDRALGTFTHAIVEPKRRVVVFDGSLREMDAWQRAGISEVATLVPGADPDAAARVILRSAA